MPTLEAEQLPFDLAIDFFRQKINLPTERWDDLSGTYQDVGFTVAGAASAELLNDLRAAVAAAIEKGIAFEDFKNRFGEIVERHGWSHRGGREWRAQLIYRQNLYQAYGAGRYQQMSDPGLMQRRPYRRYRHGGSVRPRPSHLAHDRAVYRADDPFWVTMYPPNGFGCSCFVESLSDDDIAREGLTVQTAPEIGAVMQARQGDAVILAENAPDPGFDYAPGSAQAQGRVDQIRQQAIDSLDPIMREQFTTYLEG